MNDVADISSYTVQFAGNGGATYNVAAQLPAIGLNAGDFYYVTTDSAQFYAYLGLLCRSERWLLSERLVHQRRRSCSPLQGILPCGLLWRLSSGRNG